MSRRISFALQGPLVGIWLQEHYPTISAVAAGRHPAQGIGPLKHCDLYSSYAEWSFEEPEKPPKQSARLLAHIIRAFQAQVPEGKALLDSHESAVFIKIEGGPR